MKLEGTYTFDAPQDIVWKALQDPEILANTLPGCEKLEQIGENEYKGALKVKVGPVQGKFQGAVKLLDLNEPESYTMQVDGKGAAGFMKGTGNVRLEGQGDSTLMHYSGEAQVGGKIASVGQRLLDSSAKALTRQSLDGLHEQIKAVANPVKINGTADGSLNEADVPPTPLPKVTQPSQTQFALGVAKNLAEDMIPPERRNTVLAGVIGVLFLLFVLNGWMNAVARRAANEAIERRYH
ncbi:MAG: carbon monoxide dehydrogenase subunit G [Chloroflexota bacterium]